MILLDFRNWIFDKSLGVLPNAQKELLQRDLDTLAKAADLEILNLGAIQPFSISSLIFKNEEQIAVSAIKKVSDYYSVIDLILEKENKEVVDYTEAVEEGVYFYGQNSLVAHSVSEIALCGINSFTDESLFEEYCEDFELTPFSFELPDDLLTSDIACFIGDTLLICLEYITDKKVKKELFSFVKIHGIKIVTFTKQQVLQGILNVKYTGEKLLLTKKAFDLCTTEQKKALSETELEVIAFPFLEKVGVRLRDVIL
ncbi:hypothetical protein FHR24_002443 [Wenyingzhuangia heitensis]|uniref:Uncharacterized protein n=1 Tax=Wenyingzhuangia heitensis TaxID=1487859 RepID=A0ABX0UAX2_9FLAO|nr:arginine deiminase-related protein [Wenyingzhuangia heitensis]NIJ45972.1 hypothetical protein [Wenyingzhuangia heitensis]